jgi:NhaA family Na+:H+ antiporter
MSNASSQAPAPIRFLFENSVFLIAGAVLALVWANVGSDSYRRFVDYDLRTPFAAADHHEDEELHSQEAGGREQRSGHGEHETHDNRTLSESRLAEVEQGPDGQHGGGHGHGLTFGFIVNDILMALFFAIAAKEVWEALLPGGPLSNPRKAATPLLATLGGLLGPAGLYALGVLMFSTWAELGNGWAVPCATDIAFSYLVARLIFGPGHAAIAFLLLLAIADDAAGLMILAIFYPAGDLSLSWLLLSVAAVALGFFLRKARIHSFWWYLLIPGTMSWVSFYFAGIHPALGLVPIIPTMPHARTDLGIFAREELGRHDTLSEFEHWWKNPVEIVLGLFGLVNAGVAFSSVGTGTALVLVGLIVGKPLGITLFTWIGQKFLKLEIPGGMNYRHVVSLGMVAGIGFTVALFVSTAAFPLSKYPQATLDAVKMGALGSFFAAVVAFAGARMLGIRPTSAAVTEEPPHREAPDDELPDSEAPDFEEEPDGGELAETGMICEV